MECKNYWNLSIGNWQKIGDLLTGFKTQQCNILASALWQYRLLSFQGRDRKIGILLPKLFLPTVRKNCSGDREKVLKFEAEGKVIYTKYSKH